MPETPDPLKKSRCARLCQGRLCLPLVLLAVAAGVAVLVPVLLLDTSLRERFPPDLHWWQTSIVYQIYPRSFQDTDDDGVGDIKGITSRLDHFTYLKVKAIWISPFYPSPMKDFGYDVSNFTDVDPVFGTLQDFDVMIASAHDKGLKVIVDFVAGHTSSQHDWFQQSANGTAPYHDYYIWANGTTLPNGSSTVPSNWQSVFGGSAWQWSEQRQQYYYHAFLPEQPTLNYRNPLVVKEMKDVLRFWLERGVDGIRVDAVSCIMVHEDYHQDQAVSNTPGTLPWEADHYINNLTSNQPEIETVVKGWREVLDSYDDSDDDNDNYKALIVELYEEPEVRNRYYGYGADFPFNFKLLETLDRVNHVLNPSDCDAICIRDVIQNEYDKLPERKWANFVLSNHDNNRVRSRMGDLYVDALNMLLLTLRGTPTTYYGEEIGMGDISVSYSQTQDPLGKYYGPDRYQSVSRDPERSPMQWDDVTNAGFTNSSSPWLPVNPDFRTINVETEKTSSNVTSLQVYQALAALREQPSLQYGLLRFADVTPSILSYLRSATDRPEYLVILQLGNVTVTHDFSGPPVQRGQGQVKVVTSDAANEGRFVKDASVSLSQMSLNPGDGLVIQLPVASD